MPISIGLNTPDGAGCSLTRHRRARRGHTAPGLNAPDGAGCSLTGGGHRRERAVAPRVSMHLMVLGAP